jgi:arsenite-transporting ATPase
VQLAKAGRKVLIVSTDPAHNVSDAFSQKFTSEPSPVEGMPNLDAMEVDPSEVTSGHFAATAAPGQPQAGAAMQALLGGEGGLGKALSQFPGIDETIGFATLVKTLKGYDYDTIVFDTAPTGHTLRLLSFPDTMLNIMDKLSGLKSMIGPAMAMFGGGGDAAGGLTQAFDGMKAMMTSVLEQFRNPDLTTFVAVCIPEFLSVYETERLVQELTKGDIDIHNIIVNQGLFPEGLAHDVRIERDEGTAAASGGSARKPAAESARHDDTGGEALPAPRCALCQSRFNMQNKYLSQVDVLYGEDFHITHMPILTQEVRGLNKLRAFGQFLLDPYDPVTHGSVTDAAFAGGELGAASAPSH